MFAIGASTAMCIVSFYNVWSNWKENPIIMDASSNLKPIHNIPFPAVSICPFTAFASKKFNYSAIYRLLSELGGDNSRNLTAVKYFGFLPFGFGNFPQFQNDSI